MSKNSKEVGKKVVAIAKAPAKPKDTNHKSKMGYRDDSPYNHLPFIDINTANGVIDMSQTGIPLMANGRYLPPYSGQHQFDEKVVREVPLPKISNLDKFAPKILQMPNDKKMAKGLYMDGNWYKRPDSNVENVLEIIDPTGISSWDDVVRAYNKEGRIGPQTNLEILGSIPFIGKVSKAAKMLNYVAGASRQTRNLNTVTGVVKSAGYIAPKLGRGSDAYQAYDEYKIGGWLDQYEDNLVKAQNGISTKNIDEPLPDAEWDPNYIGTGLLAPSTNKTSTTYDDHLKDARPNVGPLEKFGNVMSAPARAATYLATGKYQDPSEALGIENYWGKLATDIILDPVNLIGIGLLGKAGKIAKGTRVLKKNKVNSKINWDIWKDMFKNTEKEEGVKWLKDWYNHPITIEKIKNLQQYDDIIGTTNVNRYSEYIYPNKRFSPEDVTRINHPNSDYFFKSHSNWDKVGPDGGIIYGDTQVGKMMPKLSTTVHEGTHQLTHNGGFFNKKTEDLLQQGFKDTPDEVLPEWLGKIDKSYYTSPTEIHARINEIRSALKLTPSDNVTIKMLDDVFKTIAGKEMKPYIKNKNLFLETLNEFPSLILPIGLGTGVVMQQKKDGGSSTTEQQGYKIDKRGYHNPDNLGAPVIVPSNHITMKGPNGELGYFKNPILGVGADGQEILMQPDQEYVFNKGPVTEYEVDDMDYEESRFGGKLRRIKRNRTTSNVYTGINKLMLSNPLFDNSRLKRFIPKKEMGGWLDEYEEGGESNDTFATGAGPINLERQYQISQPIGRSQHSFNPQHYEYIGGNPHGVFFGAGARLGDFNIGANAFRTNEFTNPQTGKIHKPQYFPNFEVGYKKKFEEGGLLKYQPGGTPVGTVLLNPIEVTTDTPDRIQQQNTIIQQTKPNKNYAISDKKGNRVYYYKPSGELIKSESIITGKSNTDIDRGMSMKDWFKENNTDSHEDYIKYLETNKYQTTPAGIFEISDYRTNTADDPSKIGNLINYFRPERAKEIRDTRIRDYGEQQKMFTLKSEYGIGSSKAIHGTANPTRVDAFNKPGSDRNLSSGCINVDGKNICFDTLEKGSSFYILPEESDALLYPNTTKINKFQTKNIKNTRNKIESSLKKSNIDYTPESLAFITAVAEKESKGGRSIVSKVEEYLPYAIAHSQGDFQINPKSFKKYLPDNYTGSYDEQINAVSNFYNDNKDNKNVVELYKKYSGNVKETYSKKFTSLYDTALTVYKQGGTLDKYQPGGNTQESRKLATYDEKTDTYIATTPLKEVEVTAEAPQWLKDKRNFEQTYDKQQFANEYLPKWAAAAGETADNLSIGAQTEYDKRINNKVVENIFKRKPTFDNDYSDNRLKALEGFTQKELELIKDSKYSSKIEPSIWSKFEQGLLSVGNVGSPVQFKNPSLSQEEAKQEDNPFNILQPLSILPKTVQSIYKKDYSFMDAVKGNPNDAGVVEDLITDPSNLVGVGIGAKLLRMGSKLSKLNKFTKGARKLPGSPNAPITASPWEQMSIDDPRWSIDNPNARTIAPSETTFDSDVWSPVHQTYIPRETANKSPFSNQTQSLLNSYPELRNRLEVNDLSTQLAIEYNDGNIPIRVRRELEKVGDNRELYNARYTNRVVNNQLPPPPYPEGTRLNDLGQPIFSDTPLMSGSDIDRDLRRGEFEHEDIFTNKFNNRFSTEDEFDSFWSMYGDNMGSTTSEQVRFIDNALANNNTSLAQLDALGNKNPERRVELGNKMYNAVRQHTNNFENWVRRVEPAPTVPTVPTVPTGWDTAYPYGNLNTPANTFDLNTITPPANTTRYEITRLADDYTSLVNGQTPINYPNLTEAENIRQQNLLNSSTTNIRNSSTTNIRTDNIPLQDMEGVIKEEADEVMEELNKPKIITKDQSYYTEAILAEPGRLISTSSLLKTEKIPSLIKNFEHKYNKLKGSGHELENKIRIQLEDLRSTQWLRTESKQELIDAGLNPNENLSVITVGSGKNLINEKGTIIGTVHIGSSQSDTYLSSTGVNIKFHPYNFKKSSFKTPEAAEKALADKLYKEKADLFFNQNQQQQLVGVEPITEDAYNIFKKQYTKESDDEAKNIIEQLKENNNNRYGDILYRSVLHGIKDTRGNLKTAKGFATTSLPEPITGEIITKYKAADYHIKAIDRGNTIDHGSYYELIKDLGGYIDQYKDGPRKLKKLGGSTKWLDKYDI